MAAPSPARMRAIHRRRRLVLTLVAVVLVAATLLLWRPWQSAGDDPVASPSQSATEEPTASATATPSASPSPSPWTGVEDSDGEAETTIAACTKEQLSLVVDTDKAEYASGENVELSFTIENTSDSTCQLNVGTTQQVYTITSGGATIFDSSACDPEPGVDQLATIEPEQTWSTSEHPVSWDRIARTAEDCAATQAPAVGAGATYHVSVTVSGIVATADAAFTLQ